MTLYEIKKKILSLIEELNPESELLTDDPDISAKINSVINQIMYELIRFKKIPKYVEIEVSNGDTITFEDIEKACGYEVYQLCTVSGAEHITKASGTVIKAMEEGILEIECNVFPERITDETKDKAYEFEISPDLLEIMPYGVAADLLKSDVSAANGNIYMQRYNSMIQMLDPRYQTTTVSFKGGVRF